MSTDDRWQRVKALFQQAVERPAAERDAFLASATGDDAALRREVESLLASDTTDASLLDRVQFGSDGVLADLTATIRAAEVHPAAHALALPRQLGPYEIGAPLGAGAMGEVYRARDTKLHRDVALKILPAVFAFDVDRLARFRREAHLLAALNHPNIAAIYGLEDSSGVQALVLELVDGPTLDDRIALGPLPLTETLTIARQIADAVEAAHEKGIVHRDLKPANIKIDSSGNVKVLDFGLAKAVIPDSTRPDLSAARDGLIVGTASYMSPEQARGQPVDKRTDIWAFGCVLFEMLTGQLAFPGATVSDSIARILEREPDWSALPASTPLAIRRLLLRCLTKDARRRLRDIGDVRIEIDGLDEAVPGATELAPVVHRRFARPTLLLAAIVAILATTIGVREFSRVTRPQESPLANAHFSPLTQWEGIEGGADISPDGRFVAFIADRAGEFDLWIGQVGTEEFRNLTADLPALGAPHPLIRSFGFTGDGSEVWFSAAPDPVLPKKMRIPIGGGNPRPFLDEGDATPAWSADGARLVFFRHEPNDALFIADRTGGDARPIAVAPSDAREWSGGVERTHTHNLVWSPQDQWLYFVHGLFQSRRWTDEMDVWRVRPSSGSPERLTRQGTSVTYLAPLDERRLLYVARAADGAGPWLWELDTRTKATRRVSSGLEQYTSVAASRDGHRLAATIVSATANLWTAPIVDRVVEERDVRAYVVPTARAWGPRFGASTLFYLSARGTADGLWRVRDGQPLEVRKGADTALFDPPAVSPDGSRVAVIHQRDGRRRLAMMSADGTAFRGVGESIDVQGTADWSPDGTSIAVGGSDETEGPGLFTIPLSGGAPVRLVSGQAFNPVWSPDGNLIVYAGALTTGQVAPLLAVRPDGTPVDLPLVRVSPRGHRFLPNGTGIVYFPSNTAHDFWLFDLATKHTRQLTRLDRRGLVQSFDLTPDGTHIVFDRSREDSNIVLIDLPRQ